MGIGIGIATGAVQVVVLKKMVAALLGGQPGKAAPYLAVNLLGLLAPLVLVALFLPAELVSAGVATVATLTVGSFVAAGFPRRAGRKKEHDDDVA